LDLGMTKGLNYGVGVAPKLAKNATLTLGDPLVMFSSTKHPKETYELLKWFWNPENTMELQTSGLWMPILKKWYTDPELVKKWTDNAVHPEGYIDAVVNNAFNNGVPAQGYYVRNLPKINALLNPALDKVWLGVESAEDAMNEVAPQVQAEVQGIIPRPEM
jgi:multiple sugar transport system substrate-binding protein